LAILPPASDPTQSEDFEMTKKTFAFLGAVLMAMTLSLGACGGKSKGAEEPKAEEKATEGGGEATEGGGEANPCGGGEANPCGGGEANPCGGNPCGGGQ
jgi:hypothetical protein